MNRRSALDGVAGVVGGTSRDEVEAAGVDFRGEGEFAHILKAGFQVASREESLLQNLDEQLVVELADIFNAIRLVRAVIHAVDEARERARDHRQVTIDEVAEVLLQLLDGRQVVLEVGVQPEVSRADLNGLAGETSKASD